MNDANWFDSVLTFANAKDLRDEWERALNESRYASIFLRITVSSVQLPPADSRKRWLLQGPGPDSWTTLEDALQEQARLIKILETLEKRGPTRPLWLEICKEAGLHIRGVTAFGKRPGEFQAIAKMRPESVRRWYCFAVAELISQDLGDRVGRCALKSCQAFFVTTKRRGSTRRYCSVSHGSQARVKAKRKRDAATRRRRSER